MQCRASGLFNGSVINDNEDAVYGVSSGVINHTEFYELILVG